MRFLALFFLFILTRFVSAQNIPFSTNSDILKVKKGDIIEIQTDSAFILSGNRADYLNQRLNELDTIRRIYQGVGKQKEQLIKQVEELSALISNLKTDMVNDSIQIRNELGVVIRDLNQITNDLRNNNKALRANNEELNIRIERLNILIKELKRELRWIWWNGLTDKIVVFVAGVGVGAVLVLLF